VPYAWGTTGICYRSDLVPSAPTSWNDILTPAPENVGKITMLATDRWLLLPAQKALGFSVNTTDDDELEQVAELLTAAKDNLLAYDDTTFYSRLVSGEANLVEAWDGWCNYGIAENPDIEFVVPEEGSDLWTDTMVVLKSSENKEAAHAFINWVLAPRTTSRSPSSCSTRCPTRRRWTGSTLRSSSSSRTSGSPRRSCSRRSSSSISARTRRSTPRSSPRS
jgi:spermidine/putrescine transport system substrate-binding protein